MKRHATTTSEVFQAALEPPHHDRLWFPAAQKTERRSPRVSRRGDIRVNGGGRSDRAGLLPQPQSPGIPIPAQRMHLRAQPTTQPQLCFMDPTAGGSGQAPSDTVMTQRNDRKRSDWLGYAFMGAMFACTFLV